jgi:hypothetical protein
MDRHQSQNVQMGIFAVIPDVLGLLALKGSQDLRDVGRVDEIPADHDRIAPGFNKMHHPSRHDHRHPRSQRDLHASAVIESWQIAEENGTKTQKLQDI